MSKPRLLDLFCCAGGAAEGYRRAGFAPYGIDNKKQAHYPFPFLQMDALEALDRLLAGEGLTFSNGETLYLRDFAGIHASPPCQAYVDSANKAKHPRLIEPTRERLIATGLPYVIENVDKAPLLFPIRLCGTFFGLRVIRHRLFETSPRLGLLDTPCHHWGSVAKGTFAAAYGRGGKGPRYIEGGERKRIPGPIGQNIGGPRNREFVGGAMGIDWMPYTKLTQAIPPAYTEYLGLSLMREVLP